jgi:superoxide reductase
MKPSEQEHYSTRCTISHRPPFRTVPPIFFRCSVCGAVTVVNVPPDTGRKLPELRCCGVRQQPLEVCQDLQLLGEHKLDYVVFGGFERNAIRVRVDGGTHPMDDAHKIEWMYLRTYQGGQLKYLPTNGRSIASFSFADEDAYVYCDREICRMGREHCQFECKRGNLIYAYCSVHGLMRLALVGENAQS